MPKQNPFYAKVGRTPAGSFRITIRAKNPKDRAGSYRQLGRPADAGAAIATAQRLYPRDPDVLHMADLLRRDALPGGAAP